ncbi:MAG: hypothetical protein H0T78_04635 [Longispora sp.]|nr:hypothetical protein [Longispora sp. (in: high G+C Gram-positive bacteria)]
MTSASSPTCARCGRNLRGKAAHRFPEGHVCTTCHTWALETYGVCSGCGVDRMIPGIAPGGGRLCTSCAGMAGRSFFCLRCGAEGRRHRQGVCARCVLTDQLNDILDDGTGRVRAELLPLFEALRNMGRPRSGLTWVGYDHVQKMLRSLAYGEVELSHDGLNQLTPWRSVNYLRDLLMANGILPAADRHLLSFQRWLDQHLTAIEVPEHRQVLQRFATWHLLRKLRTAADRHPLGESRDRQARRVMTKSQEFCAWLTDRGVDLPDCGQHDLDAWHAEQFIARRAAQMFLRWAMTTGHMPPLAIVNRQTGNPSPISQHRRLALLRRLLDDEQHDLLDRVAAILVLLYAQPATRISRLTVDDLVHTGGELHLALGDPPSPVPEPFAGLLDRYLQSRPNTMTATNPDARWLFPGRRAGQPLTPDTIQLRLRRIGVTARDSRTSTIRQLVLQAGNPLVSWRVPLSGPSLLPGLGHVALIVNR